MEDLTLLERLVDVVAEGDEEESGKGEGEGGESCGVPDAEERDVDFEEVHDKDTGIVCMTGIMMLESGCECGWRHQRYCKVTSQIRGSEATFLLEESFVLL